MNAQELRLGNIVKYLTGGYGDEPFEGMVSSINEYGVCLNGYDMRIAYDELEPIPISEQWLERFGFEKKEPYDPEFPRNSIYTDFELNNFIYRFTEWRWQNSKGETEIDKGTVIVMNRHDTVPGNTPIYIHQLQNLYFALTGNELQI